MPSEFDTPLTPPPAQPVNPVDSVPAVPIAPLYSVVPPADRLSPNAYPSSGYAGAMNPYGEQPRTNGMAIASLITGCFGLSVVAIGLGVGALNRIAHTGEAGRWQAITGIALGAMTTAFWALMMVPIMVMI